MLPQTVLIWFCFRRANGFFGVGMHRRGGTKLYWGFGKGR